MSHSGWFLVFLVPGEQRDRDAERTPLCHSRDSAAAAARRRRRFPTGAEAVQVSATVRHQPSSSPSSSSSVCLRLTLPVTYHVLPALSHTLHLTFFISINFFFLSCFFPQSFTYCFRCPQSHCPTKLPSTRPADIFNESYKCCLDDYFNKNDCFEWQS